ncbi:hypothetical protein E3U43_000781 [Larimichthys crocea]|uniref:Uncharacterized protein n=1 Tax=Larimichthys crocea TaxID=215358 RepID=A0ACD3Q9F1_LARCR|nr:hypothetical protein E3U43_000781 [Larimichthys crocea]
MISAGTATAQVVQQKIIQQQVVTACHLAPDPDASSTQPRPAARRHLRRRVPGSSSRLSHNKPPRVKLGRARAEPRLPPNPAEGAARDTNLQVRESSSELHLLPLDHSAAAHPTVAGSLIQLHPVGVEVVAASICCFEKLNVS